MLAGAAPHRPAGLLDNTLIVDVARHHDLQGQGFTPSFGWSSAVVVGDVAGRFMPVRGPRMFFHALHEPFQRLDLVVGAIKVAAGDVDQQNDLVLVVDVAGLELIGRAITRSSRSI
ncbi:hypothetical protein [Saccharopolyspora sp. ASAGF58]|uniref:hypothetical protein n=1 Tax=Saccharopolyspora sp. ASAGF58 TaxID=2719023 RepID=UPI001440061C|nr:hypothetical protein [Saccharopolyspora sp. ASAGF58]QIZ35163.1 hypothetical protein FDZ84_11095 [Saccharopolyspora sp. ASAGF58]